MSQSPDETVSSGGEASAPAGKKARHGVMAVFKSRDTLEQALEALQSSGFNRTHIHLIEKGQDREHSAERLAKETNTGDLPMDRGSEGNLQGLLTGIPTYLGAVLAAGVTAASGGTLGIIALAAAGGAAGAGLAGAGLTRFFTEGVDSTFERELESGGIVILVAQDDPAEAEKAERILKEQGAGHVQTHGLND